MIDVFRSAHSNMTLQQSCRLKTVQKVSFTVSTSPWNEEDASLNKGSTMRCDIRKKEKKWQPSIVNRWQRFLSLPSAFLPFYLECERKSIEKTYSRIWKINYYQFSIYLRKKINCHFTMHQFLNLSSATAVAGCSILYSNQTFSEWIIWRKRDCELIFLLLCYLFIDHNGTCSKLWWMLRQNQKKIMKNMFSEDLLMANCMDFSHVNLQ